jgi:hypothetical protein
MSEEQDKLHPEAGEPPNLERALQTLRSYDARRAPMFAEMHASALAAAKDPKLQRRRPSLRLVAVASMPVLAAAAAVLLYLGTERSTRQASAVAAPPAQVATAAPSAPVELALVIPDAAARASASPVQYAALPKGQIKPSLGIRAPMSVPLDFLLEGHSRAGLGFLAQTPSFAFSDDHSSLLLPKGTAP